MVGVDDDEVLVLRGDADVAIEAVSRVRGHGGPGITTDVADEAMRVEVQEIVARAQLAQRAVEDWEEGRVDALLSHLSETVSRNAQALASAAVAETQMGDVADKVRKIHFASRGVFASLVGRVARGALGTDERGVTEVASPVGVVLGLLPVTNPVATMINKILICLKGRNALVLSPHRGAQKVSDMTLALVESVLRAHGRSAGAPAAPSRTSAAGAAPRWSWSMRESRSSSLPEVPAW